MDQNNILRFPFHKLKNGIVPAMTSSPLSVQQKRILISALLLSVFAVVSIINYNGSGVIASSRLTSPNRGIASIELSSKSSSDFEKSIIAKYASSQDLKPVQVGIRPSPLEKLAFGTLSGNYVIGFDSGKISSIQIGKNETGARAQKIGSANLFLEEYKSILAMQFEKAVKVLERNDAKSVQEEFDLIDKKQHRVGVATFKFDKGGHLLSLQIEKSQAVASN